MLSDSERETLAQIEAELYASDKDFARSMGQGSTRARAVGVLALLAGMGMLLAGVGMDVTALGGAGFAVALAGCLWAWYGGSGRVAGGLDAEDQPAAMAGNAGVRTETRSSQYQGLLDRLTRRWEKRREEGA